MLRRFESYTFAPGTADARIEELAHVLRRTGVHIPELLDSAVGRNESGVGADFVWEHSYADAAAYDRYMHHPFHICILDRYLLPEAPECITASRPEQGVGLFGYEVEGNPFRHDGRVRAVVLMKAAPDATPAAVAAFVASLNARAGAVAGVAASVAAVNSMGLAWTPDGWTHVWEQGFADEAARARASAGDAALLADSPMAEWIDLWYEIDADPDVPTSGNGASR